MINDQDYTNGMQYVPVDVTTYPTGITYTIPFTWGHTGWECPKCGRCYSPTTSMCSYCVRDKSFNWNEGLRTTVG
jgi:hypothetical protein